MAFHPYPQLIREVFNLHRFGPPARVTEPSPWPWVDHPASGLLPTTTIAHFGLAFASATPNRLNLAAESKSQTHYAKGTRSDSPEASFRQRPPTACKHTVSGTISFPSLGCFSPFPHGTCTLSVASEYLALEDGPPSFPRDSTCPAVLGNDIQRDRCVSLTGLSPSLAALSRVLWLYG